MFSGWGEKEGGREGEKEGGREERREEGEGRREEENFNLGNQFLQKNILGWKGCMFVTTNAFQRESPKHSQNAHEATASVRTRVQYPQESCILGSFRHSLC